jgi:hypothetical protein
MEMNQLLNFPISSAQCFVAGFLWPQFMYGHLIANLQPYHFA